MNSRLMKIGILSAIFAFSYSAHALTKGDLKTTFEPKSSSQVKGEATITQKGKDVVINISLEGLEPRSKHGFHIHENGDCSAADASSAGGHFSPENAKHGSPAAKEHHMGDLGNIVADAKGKVKKRLVVRGANLNADDAHSIKNRAIVLHAKADDLKSQPSGDAGDRIACAVIQ